MLDTFEQTILSAFQVIFDEFGWLGVFGLMIFENAAGISEYIQRHLPLIFVAGILLLAGYLVYHYRASLPGFGWMRQNKKQLD